MRRIAVPAAAVLLLTAVPVRMLQIQFVELLIRLGHDAPNYGHLLTAVSTLIVVAYIVSLYGRAVYMQACRREISGWTDLLRVDLRSFVSYVYVSLLLFLAMVITGAAVITIPFLIVLAGIAAAVLTATQEGGVLRSLRALAPYLQAGGVLGALVFVFAIALVVVAVNLTFLTWALIWLGSALPWDTAKWQAALNTSVRYDLVRVAAAVTLVEPFWLAAMHLYANRVRSRRTGEDLRKRFEALVRPAVAATMVILFAATANAESIDLGSYVGRLESIASAVSAGRAGEVRADLEFLERVTEVRSGGETFSPDVSLLAAIKRAPAGSAPDLTLLRRLQETIAALRQSSMPSSSAEADRAVLSHVRSAEKVGALWRGGDVMAITEADGKVFSAFARMWKTMIEAVAQKLERVIDFIIALFPRRDATEKEGTFLGVSFVVWGVTLLVVGVVISLSLYVIRRSRHGARPITTESIAASRRDEDPLSREANEWEIYARELMASGRYREALRAWYHAVLVTLFRAGILHYRKGLTNWEYVARISPELDWRHRFIGLTREFEREWYGHAESTAEQLDNCVSDARAVLAALHEARR